MKSLINKLIDKARKASLIAAAVASIGFAGCKLCTAPDPPIPPVNNPPVITSLPAVTEINEGSNYNYDVNATDSDGDSLEYSLSVAPSWLSINQNTGIVSGVAPEVETDTGFDVEVGVSDKVNPVVKQNYTLTVKNVIVPPPDYLDVEGYLQDNETDTTKQGIVKIYDSAKQLIGETTANSSGYFTFHSDTKKATDLSEIIIQAQATDSLNNPISYIRTIKASVSSPSEPDVSLVQPMRAVPYPDFDTGDGNPEINSIDYERFKTFMLQIDFNWYMDIQYVYHKDLLKWNLNQLQGIEVLLQNPYNEVSFTPEQQEIIANRIKSSSDIEMFIEGRQLDSLIQIDTTYPPANPHYSTGLSPDENWIIVVPNNEVGGRTYFGYLNDNVFTGTINRVRIDLMPSVVRYTSPVMTHEFGHGFIAAGPNFNGHSSILLNPLTIMTATGLKLPPPGVADVKAGRLIYEDTYKPAEELDDILGTSFY